jgi:hypothetical protein
VTTPQSLCRRRTTVPAAPTNLDAAGGNTTASISFDVPVTNGGSPITSYVATSTPGSFTGSAASSPVSVTGLANGTPYTFTVHAVNAVGNSAESAASNSATPSNPATVPGAPTIGTISAGNGQVSVPFSAPGSDGGSPILDYTAYASSGQQATGTSPILVSGLTNGVSVFCTVTARNAVGRGPESAASNSVTPSGPPDPPTIGTATAGNASASVSFTPPANNGGSAILSYLVTSAPGGITAGGSGSPINVTGLTNGVAYTFTVQAQNANGYSGSSSASNSATPTLTNHTVTLDKSTITKIRSNTGVLSDTCTATPHDGAGPFLYSWTWSSGGSNISIVNNTSATCTVTSTTSPEAHRTGTLRCTVTDQGNSNYTAYAECSVDMTWTTL